MANPNLLNVSTITAAITGFSINNNSITVLTNPVGSNKLFKISSISIGGSQLTSYNISINGYVILGQGSVSVAAVQYPIYIPEGSSMTVYAGLGNTFYGCISYVEIS